MTSFQENMKKIGKKISGSKLKELLYPFTKHAYLKFNEEIYIQTGGMAIESPLGPLLAHIFMISLEDNILPKVRSCLYNYRRYVSDIFVYVNEIRTSRT